MRVYPSSDSLRATAWLVLVYRSGASAISGGAECAGEGEPWLRDEARPAHTREAVKKSCVVRALFHRYAHSLDPAHQVGLHVNL